MEGNNKLHKLNDKWTLWAHLQHDTNWGKDSYINLNSFNYLEELLSLYKNIDDKLVNNCMLFLMRDGIFPSWEDTKNINGGCFSYKVLNNNIFDTWNKLSYSLIGEVLTDDDNLMKNINGITISPKNNFGIIKIWISNCEQQETTNICHIDGLTTEGTIFKKHVN